LQALCRFQRDLQSLRRTKVSGTDKRFSVPDTFASSPIASGVIEGACRHVVKDRLERTGMGWTVAGAQAMLSLRSLWLSDSWDAYLAFRTEEETQRLHPHRPALKEMKWSLAI
jgi:hypothetical protein